MLTLRYDVAAVEGLLLVEAAHAADALARLRGLDQPDAATQRLMQRWSKLLSTLLGQLHLENVLEQNQRRRYLTRDT